MTRTKSRLKRRRPRPAIRKRSVAPIKTTRKSTRRANRTERRGR